MKKGKQNNNKSNDSMIIELPDVTITIKTHTDKNGGHPHGIMDNIDDKHISVGFTTDNKKGKNHPNIKLDKDPLCGNKPAYMRRQATIDKKSNYSKPSTGKMSGEDYKKAKMIAEKAKAKYIESKVKKAQTATRAIKQNNKKK